MKFILSSDVAQEVTENIADSMNSKVQFFTWDVLIDYFQDSMPTVLNFLVKLIIVIIVFLVGRRLIKVVRKFIRKFLGRTNLDEGVKQFFDHLANVGLHFILIMIILGRFGITASSVIAVIGSVGLSIGLALQGSLSNFAGGVLILLLKPFVVGDYIREDNNQNEGTVTEIQLFYTKLLTVDNQTIILPNGALSNGSLTNMTQQDKRRVDINVGMSYHADIRHAKEVLRQVVDAEEKCLENESKLVFVNQLGESAVEMGIRVWVKTEDYWEVKWRMTENIKYALDENGIEIDVDKIVDMYNGYFSKYIPQCSKCYHNNTCKQCILQHDDLQGKAVCPRFMNKEAFDIYQAEQLSFLAKHPTLYRKIMTDVIVH